MQFSIIFAQYAQAASVCAFYTEGFSDSKYGK